jgi:hypothetical protein
MIAALRRWFRPAEFDWSPRMMLVMRFCIAALVLGLAMHRGLVPYEMEADKAHGLAKIAPLMWFLEPATFVAAQVLATLGLAAFVVGYRPQWSLLLPLIYGTIAGTLRQSKGDITHSTQIFYMTLLAMWVAYAALAAQKKHGVETHRIALKAAILMVAASYVASGMVKVKASDGQWIARVPSMAVQMVKSNLSDYYSKPQGEISEVFSDKAPKFFSEQPGLAKVVFGSGLLMELGAFVLILSRRWALAAGLALIFMHLGISLLMAIEFWGHMGLLTVLCVLPALDRPAKHAANPTLA